MLRQSSTSVGRGLKTPTDARGSEDPRLRASDHAGREGFQMQVLQQVEAARVDRQRLRGQIQAKYTEVALEPEKGFHFHNGRPLAVMLGYPDAAVDWLPPSTVDSFARTGNPFSVGTLAPGEVVLDIGCGAGFDTLLAARQVGRRGLVIAMDMTEAMLQKTRAGAAALGL